VRSCIHAVSGARRCVFRRQAVGRAQWSDTFALLQREVTVEAGRITCVLPVTPSVENRYSTLHGGCIATLVDVLSTAALVTVSDSSGISLDLNVSYMTAAKDGDSVAIDARVLKVGKSTALLEAELRSVQTGALVAKGRHTKFLLGLGGTSASAFLDSQRVTSKL
jgi:acyl-coenzyme A thioesterase 13